MPAYYLDRTAQESGEHEIHLEDCRRMPSAESLIYLGIFMSCRHAASQARRHNARANGCPYCCWPCHAESGDTASESDKKPPKARGRRASIG
jgi:hypothetical protein